jgi:hypothetical protein
MNNKPAKPTTLEVDSAMHQAHNSPLMQGIMAQLCSGQEPSPEEWQAARELNRQVSSSPDKPKPK